MKDFTVGSEIQSGDRLFEVIGYEEVNEELSHVMLSNGTIVEATYEDSVHINAGGEGAYDELWLSNLKHYGIIPLVEIESEPIEFVGSVCDGGVQKVTLIVPAGITMQTGMRFKCVEVKD